MSKTTLKTVTEDRELTGLDGPDITHTLDVGNVVHATHAVTGVEHIVMHLHTTQEVLRWDAPIMDYDPDTTDHDPATESRWVPEA